MSVGVKGMGNTVFIEQGFPPLLCMSCELNWGVHIQEKEERPAGIKR